MVGGWLDGESSAEASIEKFLVEYATCVSLGQFDVRRYKLVISMDPLKPKPKYKVKS